ncbi:hypothetical protein [Undibacterium flavidum]|uniref:Uncharacterized protein n=1 Tax=Undibacterium flavidum TaxID=2762297 RepID=A0ABR6YEV1_9BURK|nr:hypothetical protein [Undibacterium flavidum]MBC3875052.1 hypothetical protein [Undibacterium flavidum]
MAFIYALLSTTFANASVDKVTAASPMTDARRDASVPSKAVQARSEIPFKKDGGAASESFANVAVSFGFVLLVLAAFIFYFNLQKRRSNGQGLWGRNTIANVDEKKFFVKKRIALTSKNTLHLVEWNGAEYMIACTDQATTLIARSEINGRHDHDTQVDGAVQ